MYRHDITLSFDAPHFYFTATILYPNLPPLFLSSCIECSTVSSLTVSSLPPPSRAAVSLAITVSEGNTLTFDVTWNWMSIAILTSMPLWSVIHAATNWVTQQQPEGVNRSLLVKMCLWPVFVHLFLRQIGSFIPLSALLSTLYGVASCWMWPCVSLTIWTTGKLFLL